MQTKTTFHFSLKVEDIDYNFAVEAKTEFDAITKLKNHLGAISLELQNHQAKTFPTKIGLGVGFGNPNQERKDCTGSEAPKVEDKPKREDLPF